MANIFIATRNKLQRKMPEMDLVLFVTKRLHGFPWFSMVFHGFPWFCVSDQSPGASEGNML
jgi:hypothetical protein